MSMKMCSRVSFQTNLPAGSNREDDGRRDWLALLLSPGILGLRPYRQVSDGTQGLVDSSTGSRYSTSLSA